MASPDRWCDVRWIRRLKPGEVLKNLHGEDDAKAVQASRTVRLLSERIEQCEGSICEGCIARYICDLARD